MKRYPHQKITIYYLSSKNSNSFFVSPVSPAEVKIIINSMINGKAVGPYSIPIFLSERYLVHTSVNCFCDIINDSFSNGIFPDIMIAKVIPLYRKNSSEDPSDYRSISLLSVCNKITVKLMHTIGSVTFSNNTMFCICSNLVFMVKLQHCMH